MTPEDLNTITTELKRFGTELNLTDAQKEQLKTFLTENYQKLCREQGLSHLSRFEIAGGKRIYQHLSNFCRDQPRTT